MFLPRRACLLGARGVAAAMVVVALTAPSAHAGDVAAASPAGTLSAAASCTPTSPAAQAAAAKAAAAKKAADAKKKAAAAKKKAAAAKKKAAEAKKKAAAAKRKAEAQKRAADARKRAAARKQASGTDLRGALVLKPVVKKPVVKKPVVKKPVVKKPVVKKPVAKKPVAKKPVAKKPVAKKPVTKKPVAKKPVAKKPVASCTVAPLPVVPGALDKQPGPVAQPPAAPLVPTVTPLGRTPASYFGVHGRPTADAADGFASVRLWDTGTTWADIQPTADTWDWSTLDAAVTRAQAEGYSPLLVLGQTPAWASSDPSAPGVGRAGASMPPSDLGRWSAYVSAVASRYRGRIAGYEMWNEPNFVGDYYHGSEASMAKLTELAHDAIKAADPSALVVSPGFATRTKGQQGWAFRYFDAVDASDLDVISLHLYPMPHQLPEDAVGQLESVVKALRARRISKPVWNTELNYGVTGGTADAVAVPDPLGGAYIARTLLADRAAGIDRVFWYSWGTARILGISVDATPTGLTPAAQAWMRVAGWLGSSTLVGCSVVGDVHACSLRPDSGGWGQVLWSETDGHSVRGSKGTTAAVGLYGNVSAASAGASIAVGQIPVLVLGGGADATAMANATPRG